MSAAGITAAEQSAAIKRAMAAWREFARNAFDQISNPPVQATVRYAFHSRIVAELEIAVARIEGAAEPLDLVAEIISVGALLMGACCAELEGDPQEFLNGSFARGGEGFVKMYNAVAARRAPVLVQ